MNRFYKWYDALQEPWRFLLAMGIIMSGITALSFGNSTVKLVGALYLAFLTITRMWYVGGK